MAFKLDNYIIDDIVSASVIDNNDALLYTLDSLKKSAINVEEKKSIIDWEKIENIVSILNSDEHIFDVDAFNDALNKSIELNIAFAEYTMEEIDTISKDGRLVKKFYKSKYLCLYYPNGITNKFNERYAYTQEGDYVYITGPEKIDAICEFMDEVNYALYGIPKPKPEPVLPKKTKKEDTYPSKEVLTKFISNLGIAIGKLKLDYKEEYYQYDYIPWDELDAVIKLQEIMDNSIELLNKIKG